VLSVAGVDRWRFGKSGDELSVLLGSWFRCPASGSAVAERARDIAGDVRNVPGTSERIPDVSNEYVDRCVPTEAPDAFDAPACLGVLL